MKHYKYLFLIVTSILFLNGNAQVQKYWIVNSNTSPEEFQISKAQVALSQRALDRRVRQGIPLRPTDFSRRNPVLEESFNELGIQVHGYSRWLNAYSVIATPEGIENFKKNSDSEEYDVRPVMSLSTQSNVQTTPLIVNRALTPVPPPESSFYDYGQATAQTNQVHGEALHDAGYDGSTMLIAVIDASFFAANDVGGFDRVFDEGRVVATYDFVMGDTNVFRAISAHGMHVWSTMAAENDGVLVGSAPKASYALLRSEDAQSETKVEEDNWIMAAEFADSIGADVINSSLTYNTFDSGNDYTMADMDGRTAIITLGAVQAQRAGILVVNSSGNSGATSWNIVGAPADADSILTVGAVDSTGVISPSSSVGPTADGRIKPDVVAQGVLAAYYTTLGLPARGNGTSFSSPIIAGFAACLWEAYPNETNYQILERIRQSAHLSSNPNNTYGYGIPNFAQALSGEEVAQPIRNLTVQPNPTQGRLFVELNLVNPTTYTIVDIHGREVQTGLVSGDSDIVLASELSNGVYVLQVILGGNVHQARVVLNR